MLMWHWKQMVWSSFIQVRRRNIADGVNNLETTSVVLCTRYVEVYKIHMDTEKGKESIWTLDIFFSNDNILDQAPNVAIFWGMELYET